jgi:hypothetical protein
VTNVTTFAYPHSGIVTLKGTSPEGQTLRVLGFHLHTDASIDFVVTYGAAASKGVYNLSREDAQTFCTEVLKLLR